MTNSTTATCEGYSTFTSDFTSQVQIARSFNGKWFRRFQERHPMYGYRWTAWKACGPQDESRLSCYLYTNLARDAWKPIKWRLPN